MQKQTKVKPKNIGYKFDVKAISIDYFEMINPKEYQRTTKVDLIKLAAENKLVAGFEVGTRIGYFEEEGIFQIGSIVDIVVNINHKKKQAPINVGKVEVTFDFHIKDFAEILKENHGFIPKVITVSCLSIAVSTTRGVLLTKSAGTFMGQLNLPIIPMQHLEEMADNILPIKQKR